MTTITKSLIVTVSATATLNANRLATPPAKATAATRPNTRWSRWAPLLLAGALLTVGARPAQARCYTPTEQTAGWKRAEIPDAAPGLAVTESASSLDHTIDQFRANEPAVVWHNSEQGRLALVAHRLGQTEYMFNVDGVQWQLLRFRLAHDLAGEKIDVVAYTDGGPVPIWLERRTSGAEVAIEWTLSGVHAVAVTFHHHLREKPLVTSWQSGLRTTVSAATWLPAGFRQPRSLYYYHPGGQTLVLCDEPGHELRVRRATLSETTPTTVQLLPR